MPSHAATCRSVPFGLSFGIEELVAARTWAEQRRLTMAVVLDRVIDGVEFEEMLLLLTQDGRRRVLTIWRTQGGVVTQAIGRMPRVFATLPEALAEAAPPHKRRRWFVP